jgi:hypothetical protein
MNRRITRAHALIGVAALLCVLVVPLTATGSGGGSGAPEATASGVKKQIKKLKRKVKKLQQQVDEIELQPGPQGEQGSPGQDATKLFAYIGDGGSPATATVRYGSGVTAVTDTAGTGSYTVTFNRSLVNCVAQAVPGFGDPTGIASQANSSAQVLVSANHATVTFIDPAGNETDTSFLITAFC